MITTKCYDEQQLLLSKADTTTGICGIIISSFITTNATKIGISIGSILTIITAITMYWHYMNETMKLSVGGIGLAIL